MTSTIFSADHYAYLYHIHAIPEVPPGLAIRSPLEFPTFLKEDLIEWKVLDENSKLTADAEELFLSVKSPSTQEYITGTIYFPALLDQKILDQHLAATKNVTIENSYIFSINPMPSVNFIISLSQYFMTTVIHANNCIIFHTNIIHTDPSVHIYQELLDICDPNREWEPLEGVDIHLSDDDMEKLKNINVKALQDTEKGDKALQAQKDLYQDIQKNYSSSSQSLKQAFTLMNLPLTAIASLSIDKSTPHGLRSDSQRKAGINFFSNYGLVVYTTTGKIEDRNYEHRYLTGDKRGFKFMVDSLRS